MASLLLVDGDARSRGTIAFGFAREGWAVVTAIDEEEALRLLEAMDFAALVVVDGPRVVACVEALRASARAEGLPLVVLTDDGVQRRVLDAGADECLLRPVFLRDLVTVVRLAERRGALDELDGDLADFGLYFLVRALHASGRSMILRVERTSHQGELVFRDGELVRVRLGRLAGLGAFLQILLWRLARFRLSYVVDKGERELFEATDKLLEDGRRFAAEFESSAGHVGGTHSIYRAERRQLEGMRGEMPESIYLLAQRYDGCRLLIDVIEESPYRPADTVLLTMRLAELGVIVRCPDQHASRAMLDVDARDWLLKKR